MEQSKARVATDAFERDWRQFVGLNGFQWIDDWPFGVSKWAVARAHAQAVGWWVSSRDRVSVDNDTALSAASDRHSCGEGHVCNSRAPGACWNATVVGLSLGILPGIENQRPAGFEMTRVSSHDVQAVLNGGRGQESIDGRNDDAFLLGSRCEFAPKAAGVGVDAQDTVAELRFKTVEPGDERLFLATPRKQSDTFGDLANGESAEE